jgi:hypothetical protein
MLVYVKIKAYSRGPIINKNEEVHSISSVEVTKFVVILIRINILVVLRKQENFVDINFLIFLRFCSSSRLVENFLIIWHIAI